MSWLSSFMHPERGYAAGQGQLDQYYNQGQGYQQPYNDMGQQAGQGLNTAMGRLLDPAALQNEWSQGYEMSPQAQQTQELAKQQGLSAMSAQGVMGSTPALQAMQAGESQIGLNDRQNYLDNLMQKYQAGVGIGENMYGIGANSAGQMGQRADQMGQNSAQMQYGQQNAPGSLFGNLMGAGVGLAGSALGGPIGGAMGAKLGQMMGASQPGSYNPGGMSAYGGR
tara:strand:+ start:1425 stop:2096 length:672 start_codon:yes stop_codon:yes gene_type:complete